MSTEIIQRLTAGISEMAVYIAIALVMLVGVVKCIYPVLRNGTLLNRAVLKLEKSLAERQVAAWQEPRFLGRALRGDWQRFLVNAGQMELRGMPCNIEEYINEDTVIYKPGHVQLAELIPSLLTSLGILGTFLGLMEGLTSLDFADASGTIESIPALLGGMRFAFATSVAGIACSLIFNMLNRIMVGRAFKALDTFEEAFYELAMPRPLDPDVQMLCQKQDDDVRMQQMAERVAGQISGSLEHAISRAMHPLTMSLDTFIKGMTQEQLSGVKTIVGQFVKQLNTSLEGQMVALAETMRVVNQGQLDTQNNLLRSLQTTELLLADAKRIEEASRQIADRMQHLSDEMREDQKTRVMDRQAIQEGQIIRERLMEELTLLTESLDRMKLAAEKLTERLDSRESVPASAGDAGTRKTEAVSAGMYNLVEGA